MEYKSTQTEHFCSVRLLDEVSNTKSDRELCEQQLLRENIEFSGTQGISENNRKSGFLPAFLDTYSGISVISRFTDGQPAPIHILDGLPKQWIKSFDENGAVATVREGIIAGFIRAGRFYTREEAVIAH